MGVTHSFAKASEGRQPARGLAALQPEVYELCGPEGFRNLIQMHRVGPLEGTLRAIRSLPLQNPRKLCVLGALCGEKTQINPPRRTRDWVGTGVGHNPKRAGT